LSREAVLLIQVIDASLMAMDNFSIHRMNK
jgi:hypothetical protein